jgi:hypothetical protein
MFVAHVNTEALFKRQLNAIKASFPIELRGKAHLLRHFEFSSSVSVSHKSESHNLYAMVDKENGRGSQ